MLTKQSVKKPFTVLVAVIMIIVFGVVSFTRMTPDLFPKIDLPYVAVFTTYPGASSQEVEKTVTQPLEQQMASLENLKNISSVSQDNASIILLEFEQDAELDTVSVDIRDKIDLSKSGWDDTVQTPVIMKLNPSMIPTTVAAVSVKGSSTEETSALLSEELLRKLEGTEGVASVTTAGLVENSVYVSLDEKKIDEINEKIQNAVSDSFADAKKSVNNQIAAANDSIAQLEAAKGTIKSSQDMLAENSQSVKDVIKSLKTLAMTKEGLESANETLKTQIASQLPEGATEEEINAACEANSVYKANVQAIAAAKKAMDGITEQLAPFSGFLSQMGIDVNKLNTLDEVTKAESSLNENLQKTENSLNNGMAEIAGNSALLNSANMQLQSSLSQIALQEASGKASASQISSYLTPEGISSLITAQNFEMPAGYISEDGQDVIVTVGDKIDSPDELKNTVLLDLGIDGVEPITLADVAAVTYMADGEKTYSKINGEDGIMLVFSKQSDYGTTEVAENIKDRFDELSGEYDGLEFSVLSDQGDYINIAIDSVLESLVLGGLFAILVLFFFLRDFKPTIITALSIPISITFAIVLMYFTGVTLNIISLAGLAVGTGMLVDNSIVVIENIYRLRSLGYSKIKAAVSGAAQVAGAITASTLTTVCVFLPIVFVDGITKTVFVDMALTVTYSLMASLIVALTLVPTMGSTILGNIKKVTVMGPESKTVDKYRNLAEKALNHKAIVLVAVVVLLVATTGLTLSKGFEFIPDMSTPQVSATVQMPEEASDDDCVRTYDEISEKVWEIDGVSTVGATLSSNTASLMGLGGTSSGDMKNATFYVLLDEDKIKNGDKVADVLSKTGEENGAEVSVSSTADMSAMMGGGGISIRLEGDDLNDLRSAAIKVQNALGDIEGVSEVSDVNENSSSEIKVIIDREKAMKHGLTVAQVYTQISSKLSGESEATSIEYEGSERSVIVSSDAADDKMSQNQLMNMEISAGTSSATGASAGSGEAVRLKDIANVQKDKTIDTITRTDQKRAQTVTASVDEGYNITLTTDKAEAAVEKLELPESVNVVIEGENEQIMDAMGQLVKMFLLGIFLIYLVMVAQFQSLLSPFIVMFTIPLAITGAMAGLLITGNVLSVVAMVGIIMLMGIIVNNAIVLIDCINRLRAEGMDRRKSIIEAGAIRMRPVLMTAATTILGLLPMAVGTGSGSEMIQPVAVVCIGGLLYATLMTLFVIPVMYDILASKKTKVISEDELTITLE